MILDAGLAKFKCVKKPIIIKVNGDPITGVAPKVSTRSRHCRLPRNTQRDRLIIDQPLGILPKLCLTLGLNDLACKLIPDEAAQVPNPLEIINISGQAHFK